MTSRVSELGTSERERIIERCLPNALAATNLGVGKKIEGKVRDIYVLPNDRILLVTTDRLTAFDRSLTNIPFKGQVLNLTSAWWFEQTKHIVQNHLISVPDPNAVLVRKCSPFPVEFVMRGYMTGTTSTSIWTQYKNGVRNYCGNILPQGMKKNQKLNRNIITPTTKDAVHDRPITPDEIVEEGLMSQLDWDTVSEKAFKLFEFGQRKAQEQGLILVDTKYEFGKDENGEVVLIDEIHTPDSSRYWIASSYEERFAKDLEPENIDKEFVRRWYADNCDPYKDETLPTPPQSLLVELSMRYIQLYETITGKVFDMNASLSAPPEQRLLDNIRAVAPQPRRAVLITDIEGSTHLHLAALKAALTDEGVAFDVHHLCPNTEIHHLLKLLKLAATRPLTVFISVPSRADHISGVVAANTQCPVLTCPAYSPEDFSVLIGSSMKVGKGAPCMTVLDPRNCAMAVKRIFGMCAYSSK